MAIDLEEGVRACVLFVVVSRFIFVCMYVDIPYLFAISFDKGSLILASLPDIGFRSRLFF